MTPQRLAARLTGQCDHPLNVPGEGKGRVRLCVKARCMNKVCPDCGVYAGQDTTTRNKEHWYWCWACRDTRTDSLIKGRT